MNAQSKIEPAPLAKLREAFPDHHISKLPKETRNQIDERKSNRNSAVNCKVCGGWHHKNAVHLDYVGHAALTDRLLDTDIEWSWEPMAFDDRGLPAFDNNGGLWIRLTVCGVTRIGYGSADGKNGGDAKKEIIGDALRNAAMRFGAALDLWHKGDLHLDDDGEAAPEAKGGSRKPQEKAVDQGEGGMPDAEWAKLAQLLKATSTSADVLVRHFKVKNLRQLDQGQYAEAIGRLNDTLAKMAKEQSNRGGQSDDIDADEIPF